MFFILDVVEDSVSLSSIEGLVFICLSLLKKFIFIIIDKRIQNNIDMIVSCLDSLYLLLK